MQLQCNQNYLWGVISKLLECMPINSVTKWAILNCHPHFIHSSTQEFQQIKEPQHSLKMGTKLITKQVGFCHFFNCPSCFYSNT